MSGRIELVKGDMFDGPCDMVVVPCSTIPTVTWFVADRLRSFQIPEPKAKMRLGEVVFRPLTEAEHIAQTVAYAASVVPGGGSREDALFDIGVALAKFSVATPWVRIISCPLLGSGAGEIDPSASASYLSNGFLTEAPEDALLRLFVLEEGHYRRIESELTDSKGGEQGDVEVTDRPVRVFLSYTRSSDEHANWVKSVGSFLRSHGVDARLDAWHLRPGMDVAQWMCNEIDLADRVLLFCDQVYAQKADRRHGGVGWEIRLVQGDLLQSQSENPDKYVPIVVNESITAGTPGFLKSVYCLHWPASKRDEAKRLEELLEIVYRVQEEAPPLGQRPSFVIGRSS